MMKAKKPILFLDRDGVINERPYGAYVLSWSDFVFCEGGLSALAKISGEFERIIVVTNQMGVHKGLMTSADLADIHANMRREIELAGGRIDAIYAAEGAREDIRRKPQTTMAEEAALHFCFNLTDVALGKMELIMVGDTASDMEFGQRLGAQMVLIATAVEDVAAIQAAYPKATTLPSLAAFADHWLASATNPR